MGMCPEGRVGGPTEKIQSSSPLPLWALTHQSPSGLRAGITVWGGQPGQCALVARGPGDVREGAGAGPALQGREKLVYSAQASPDTLPRTLSWRPASPPAPSESHTLSVQSKLCFHDQ